MVFRLTRPDDSAVRETTGHPHATFEKDQKSIEVPNALGKRDYPEEQRAKDSRPWTNESHGRSVRVIGGSGERTAPGTSTGTEGTPVNAD